MFSFIASFFNFAKKTEEDEEEEDQEDFLAEQLVELEAADVKESTQDNVYSAPEIPRTAECFQRTGVITYKENNYVLIDGMLYFDLTACSLSIDVDDRVLYLGYKDSNDSIIVVRILNNLGLSFGDEEETEQTSFKVIEHVLIGEVDCREDRFVYIKENDLKFNLDDVAGAFVPTKGDWLELTCTVQFDEDKPTDINASKVLQVSSFKALRSKIKSATITYWQDDTGTCDKQIYFNRQHLQNGFIPKLGAKVMIEAIESNQGSCTWRAIKIIPIDDNNTSTTCLEKVPSLLDEEKLSLQTEQQNNIAFTYPIKFEVKKIDRSEKITVNIANDSDQIHTINKWVILSKKRDSQIEIKPFITRPIKLQPGKIFQLTITCYPKFLGSTKECLVVIFKGFQVKRFIEINVSDDDLLGGGDNIIQKTECEKMEMMRYIRHSNGSVIGGIRPVKPPNFIPVKMGQFPIPDKLWSAVLGDSNQAVNSPDFNKILERIETHLPCLIPDLNIHNYVEKWHTLLYMEEIQANISMRVYDAQKVFLIRCQEYIAYEITGLSEKRPSLIKGDRAIVCDIWDPNTPKYEGFIHAIKGDLILMKFSPHFHETYSGGDVSIEFHFSRSIYRRAHQAINLALSNLGSELLFPSKLLTRPPQVTPDIIEKMVWFNEKLNDGQKAAVTNILLGEGRPLPYCIFGPPGTGKTVTIIETILQILTLLPDSRILVATPSNSAANLITERLLQCRETFSSSMIRLIANYLLDSENLPDIIKPFCATLDIAREDTSKSKQMVRDGINLNCQTSFIGRHRVTIGTCYCIGTLAQMGLPRGHFTHVIVDEAGQATEPEIMIPLTFTDKDNGQIILAGDPMQLGPVIISKYCKEFGMDESYLSRILESYPYQRDFDAFKNGYNNKLVTKLNDNYRSLEEVLQLPSELFYDDSLIPNLKRDQEWVKKTLEVVSEVTDATDTKTGGIYVYGIRGHNARAEDSPSWYNPQEASMVALTTCKLFKKGLNADDIGVITPYIAQIRYLKLLFDGMGLPQPKIGTVEEFQGQERPIILLSTVRSTESLVVEDQKYTLGFVKNPKRLNVALTRAQIAVILFCNPHLLCTDRLWNTVIARAVRNDKYMGCDLPSSLHCDKE